MTENKKSSLWEFAKSIIGSLIFVTILTNFIVKPIQVNQSSMYPTLKDKELGFSNILTYRLFGADRFDVVIFYAEALGDHLVKRVIALPGETLEYRDDVLYINDQAVEEAFLDAEYKASFTQNGSNFTTDFGPYTLAEDEVFLMGDNRPYSSDSRILGPFRLDDILCKDAYIFYPLDEIRIVLGD